ncbi:hypothetical protein [Methanohalobium sp.]|uniref:hypothetical protein n=1 Tax=Methanohalobium sp. TaxID=2837493 RepID=UPI0025CE0A75|nr:hypothetical protein [Methanohalobium sp.]
MSDPKITEIEKKAINNTLSEYAVSLSSVKLDTLQKASAITLDEHDYKCSKCGTVGGVNGDEQLVLVLKNPVDEYDSKEDAIFPDNLTPVCQDCYNKTETTDEAVATTQTNTDSISDRTKYSVKGFEKIVANNTPSLFFKNNFRKILTAFIVLSIGLIGYGAVTTPSGFRFYTSLIGEYSNIAYSLLITYPVIVFIGLLPLIGVYTLLEYYTPPQYFQPSYYTGYSVGPITIPYFFFIFTLISSTAVWTSVTITNTLNYTNIAPTNPYIMVTFILSFGLLLITPREFIKIVNSDKSTIIARSITAKASNIAIDYDDVVINPNSNNKTTPKLDSSHIQELFTLYETDDVTGTYYYPVLWIWLVNTTTLYAIIAILFREVFSNIVFLGAVYSPFFIMALYTIYRYYYQTKVNGELTETTNKMKSNYSIEDPNDTSITDLFKK